MWLSGAVLCQEIAHVGCELRSVLCFGGQELRACRAEALFAFFLFVLSSQKDGGNLAAKNPQSQITPLKGETEG